MIRTRGGVAAMALAGLAAVMMLTFASRPVQAREAVVVFAAASLKNALEEVTADWSRETGHAVRASYAGSSKLARQIQQGAPADVFISANRDWMDALEQAKLIDACSRRDVLSNRLVLIAHGRDAAPVDVGPGLDLAGLLGDRRLVMAIVDAVPAGIYGKAALTSLGLWEKVRGKVAQAENVRAALVLVARGEAPYGIVYETDAGAADNVTVVGRFPPSSHPAIVYPAAVVAGSRNARQAARFLAHLQSAQARIIFERHGFRVGDPVLQN
jgi:molybdate transport system substrate-binding protein